MSKTTPEVLGGTLAELRQVANGTIATRKECEVEQKMLYVVIVPEWGSGDDVVGVFDNKGDAEILCGGYEYGKVEEHPLNPTTELLDLLKRGDGLYTAKMAFDGGVISVDRAFPSAWHGGLVNEDVSIHPERPYDDFVSTDVIARDEQHARAIAGGRGEEVRQYAATIPGQRRERAKEEAERKVKMYADELSRRALLESQQLARNKAALAFSGVAGTLSSSAPVGMLPEYIPPEPVKPEPVTEKHVQAAYDKLFGKCLSPETIVEMADKPEGNAR